MYSQNGVDGLGEGDGDVNNGNNGNNDENGTCASTRIDQQVHDLFERSTHDHWATGNLVSYCPWL